MYFWPAILHHVWCENLVSHSTLSVYIRNLHEVHPNFKAIFHRATHIEHMLRRKITIQFCEVWHTILSLLMLSLPCSAPDQDTTAFVEWWWHDAKPSTPRQYANALPWQPCLCHRRSRSNMWLLHLWGSSTQASGWPWSKRKPSFELAMAPTGLDSSLQQPKMSANYISSM
jgi:hypothetical protein